MKALIASLTALGLIATPIVAQTTNTAAPAKSKTTMKASKSIAKEAKAEGESTATEAKEHKAAARKHHRRHHARKHHMAMKSTKTTKTATKSSFEPPFPCGSAFRLSPPLARTARKPYDESAGVRRRRIHGTQDPAC
jgi:hypothetical protein